MQVDEFPANDILGNSEGIRRALRLSTDVVLYPRVPYHDGLDVTLLYIFGLATTGAYLS